ncbi:MAG: hypothetical protein MUQ65_04695, partial [Armatimonadetes bacterium]|nr:hypothetical protein [Armatimonadota bacterium]
MHLMRFALFCLTLSLLAVGAAAAQSDSDSYQPPMLEQQYHDAMLAVGDWTVELRGPQRWLPVVGSVTAMAFAPGRKELAYATIVNGRSSLWVATIPDLPEEWWERRTMNVRRRQLRRAPEGAQIVSPVRWSPNGARLAAIEAAGDLSTLLSIDYLTGESTTLARAPRIIDVAWHPNATHVAYVTEAEDARDVWLQTIPPTEPHRIGEGGFNLRWSLDGTLVWLRADSEVSWSEHEWVPASSAVSVASTVPARTSDTLWSPDGTLCAALEPAERDGEMNLAIYPANSTAPDIVPLPRVRPNRLLCWSSDSKIILLLAQDNWLLAAAARPPGSGVLASFRARGRDAAPKQIRTRLSLCGFPIIDPSAGPPAWSSGGDLVAVAGPDRAQVVEAWPQLGETNIPYNMIVVTWIDRRYMKPPTPAEAERKEVDYKSKNLALALQMYLADNNDIFPAVEDMDQVRTALDPYVRSQDVFMRPGTTDEVMFIYLVPPGTRLVDIQDPVSLPVAIVDYASGFYSVAFGDGHVWTYDRTPENEQMLEDWWAEFNAL